jgi:hypothetical protein
LFVKNLKEWEHYIPVKEDLSDFLEKVSWCLKNYDEASVIAQNAFYFAEKYLTRESCYEEWARILLTI